MSYVTAMIQVHSLTSAHVTAAFDDMLNQHAKAGFRFCYAINCGKGMYLMIFEKIAV